MANSKSPPPNNDALSLRLSLVLNDVLAAHPQANTKLLIALSGGLDSSVLLHLLHQLQSTQSVPPFQLSAMHVHHGLSPHADVWVEHCQKICAQYAIPLEVERVKVNVDSGLGVEASARLVRYKALARYAALHSVQSDYICLAHHQDDQAETLLLQLARGASAKGLSAMAALDAQRKLLRPLLDVSRAQLEAYAKQHALTWIDDESNQDTQYDRNFMRHRILPAFEIQYPAIRSTLARTAQHMAETQLLLEDLAALDAAPLLKRPSAEAFGQLHIAGLATLPLPRGKNVMRWWLSQYASAQHSNLQLPSTEHLTEIMQQLLHAKANAAIHIKIADGLYLKRYLDYAYLVPELPDMPAYNLHWQGEPEIHLSAHSRLIFAEQLGQGIALKKLERAKLRIKNREGGERFRPEKGRPSRTIKRMMQEHTIPPWQREHLPLIFMEETLVMIPNLAVAADVQAAPDEMGLTIHWTCH
ncbi:MAG TPA: tRNA lysidine(34) synthetase TilS [Methylophilus sp.]